MATHASIIAAIDTAIETWAGKPQSLSINGRTTVYRSLADLVAARQHYAQLDQAKQGAVGFQIHHITSGGPT